MQVAMRRIRTRRLMFVAGSRQQTIEVLCIGFAISLVPVLAELAIAQELRSISRSG
jgi:hypothetical protein